MEDWNHHPGWIFEGEESGTGVEYLVCGVIEGGYWLEARVLFYVCRTRGNLLGGRIILRNEKRGKGSSGMGVPT